mgnify:CR=1 FL=1
MEKAEKLLRYREANKTARKGQIVFAGSSLMEMFPVEKLLRERGIDATVYNRGIGGYVTREMLDNLDVCVTDLQPRRVFINIGTNDLSDASVTIDALIARYDHILTLIEQAVPGVRIYLMAYYPVNYEAAAETMKPNLRIRTNERINEANRAVEQLAARHGQRYIDVNLPLKDEQGRLKAEYTIEGMHLKPEGYRAIFPAVAAYIMEA